MLGLIQDDHGLSSVEYAMLLSFVAAGITVAANELGIAVEDVIENAIRFIVD